MLVSAVVYSHFRRTRYGRDNVVLSDIWKPTQKILSEGVYVDSVQLYVGVYVRLWYSVWSV